MTLPRTRASQLATHGAANSRTRGQRKGRVTGGSTPAHQDTRREGTDVS
jgi:hypothetical protein